MKYIVDTSFLSSLLNSNDDNYNKANMLMNQVLPEDDLLIPLTTLLEFSLYAKNVLYIRLNVEDLLDSLIASVIYFNKNLLQDFYDFVQNTKYNLKPNDYSICFLAHREKATLFTFDKKLAKYCE